MRTRGIVLATSLLFTMTAFIGCGSGGGGSDTPSNEYYLTTTYDYEWPDDITGYRIRMTDTEFVKEDRLFQEFLQEGYSHAFVYDFLTENQFEIYGYENDNAKYSSEWYDASSGESEGTNYLYLTTKYTYINDGVALTGYDTCELHPTSQEAGVYMCWGKYPETNPLYDAKTGTYEIILDPSNGYVE